MTRIAITLPPDVAKEARRRAHASGLTVSQLVSQSLERELALQRLGEFVAWGEACVGPLSDEEVEAARRELRGDD